MCLLDAVLAWDKEQILCSTQSHRRSDNPLLENGSLDAVALIEYGAQAAAVHAGLLQQGMGQGSTAFIGAIKALKIYVAAVDLTIDTLRVEAHCVLNNSNGAIYQIVCGEQAAPIIEGRVVLVLPS